MKKTVLHLIFGTLIAAAAVLTPLSALAGTVITSPIDSRPISNEYLGNLVELGNDKFIAADKKNLDYFSPALSDSHLGDSKKVRANIEELVSQNNKRTTTVILNSSSYVTNGLVGSRFGKNYADYKEAMDELEKLLSENKEPTYYFNLIMPRSLPETRFNTIWREKDSPLLYGIGHFYLQSNPDAKDAEYIKANYSKVIPAQFLLEYGYVENKATELGKKSLTEWELAFLNYFHSEFLHKEPYKSYILDYQKPYKATADMFSYLLKFKKEGLLDEIIISSDDLQLPNSIIYFSEKNADWIQKERSTPIKYSFPRTMLSIDNNSIYKQFDREYGSRERSYALTGMGKNINFIFSVDEVPQLIYARSLSKSKNIKANINIITNGSHDTAGKFDVKAVRTLADSANAFVSAGKNKTDRIFDLYLYNYNTVSEPADTLLKMKKSYNKGNNIGLIEIFSGFKENTVFKKILEDNQGYPSVSELSSYSAWNTNGNAIGLGIAHSHVYAIIEQANKNPSNIVNAQVKMLAQHIFEDGVYTKYGKLELVNAGYKPTASETAVSERLYTLLNDSGISFNDRIYRVGNEKYKIKSVNMTAYGFPWQRTFDILLDFNVKTEKIQAK